MRKRTRQVALPDITPLIDVVFLLLIFFMVSTVFKKDELKLLLNLPKTESGESVEAGKNKNLTIEVTSKQIAINGKTLSIEGLEEQLKTIKNKLIPIEMRIDKEVKYDRLMKILDKLKKFELTNLSLISDS